MILGVIPVRYESTRFPGKPLVDIKGKTMVQRVYEQAIKAKSLDQVIIATDDERIFSHVREFGGRVEMTKKAHQSGTDRLVEIAKRHSAFSHYINIQGDEPFLDPQQIDLLCKTLTQFADTPIATLVHPISDPEILCKQSKVKVVLDHEGFALYFSRSPIPFLRSVSEKKQWVEAHTYFQHIGIYGFERKVLLKVPEMKTSVLEKAESLEQLRWLANGYKIRTASTFQTTISIDTPEDLKKLLESLP